MPVIPKTRETTSAIDSKAPHNVHSQRSQSPEPAVLLAGRSPVDRITVPDPIKKLTDQALVDDLRLRVDYMRYTNPAGSRKLEKQLSLEVVNRSGNTNLSTNGCRFFVLHISRLLVHPQLDNQIKLVFLQALKHIVRDAENIEIGSVKEIRDIADMLLWRTRLEDQREYANAIIKAADHRIENMKMNR
jgi:hypothetical protein